MENKDNCCSLKNNSDKKGFLNGIIYGLLPHAFCIGFIVFSIIGATTFTVLFKNALMIPYFFHFLVAISFIFATISAIFYLKSKDCLCFSGIKSKWRYLTILYSVTILVNFFMFFAVFPVLANINSGSTTAQYQSQLKKITMAVDIPCSGHSILIIDELKNIQGVQDVKFEMPNNFEIKYDPTVTSVEKITSLDVFKTYKATIQ